MTLSLRYAALSDVGLVRSGNEDSGYAGPRLLVVADGMGGHAAGEVASSIVVASMAGLDDDDLGGDLLDALSVAVGDADRALTRTISSDAALEGMGTTLTALLWSGSRVGLAHVGDSRAYLMRGGDLLRLTHDHTYVQSLVDAGRISAEEAENHPRRSLLTRAMDGRNPAQADLSVREVRVGDRFLLCSDGLTGVVSESTLADEMATGTPRETAEQLVALALRSGAPDNVTVVVADVVDLVDSGPLPITSAEVVGAAGDPSLAARADAFLNESPAGKARRALGADALADEERRTADRIAAEAGHERSWQRRRWIKRLALVALAAGLLVAAGYAALGWINTQYFVGVEDGQVAVFQGVNQQVGAIQMSKAYEVTTLQAARLPELDRERVEQGIAADDLDDAQRIVERLEVAAATCDLPIPAGGCPEPEPAQEDEVPTPQSPFSPTAPALTPAPTATP